MKKLTAVLLLMAMAGVIVLVTQCNSGGGGSGKFTDTVITAVNLPETVPGFHFPEDSNKIYSWINGKTIDTASIYKHAWGIWAGLTAESGQTFQKDSLLIYQTWLGVSEIQSLIINGRTDDKSINTKSKRVELSVPHQLKDAVASAKRLGGTGDEIDSTTLTWTSVAYDPEAASHVIKNSLFKLSVINKYAVSGGIGGIPPFPQKAMTIKPVYYVGHAKDSLIRVPAWHGPPATPQAYGYAKWNSYVYADMHNKQAPGKVLVPVTTPNPTPQQIAAATCNVSDFIYLKLDTTMAAYMNEQQKTVQKFTAHTGDIALLVAMHVTTKEISNWTWQTFYWAPNPTTPFLPSSNYAASLKPALHGAANHYAMGAAYTEVSPNLESNDRKKVSPVLVYNPYLEAPFGAKVFGTPNKLNPAFKYGVQTNCRSCHSFATTSKTSPYSTDQFVNMKDTSLFNNTVQLDFAFSIQAAFITGVTTTTAKPKK